MLSKINLQELYEVQLFILNDLFFSSFFFKKFFTFYFRCVMVFLIKKFSTFYFILCDGLFQGWRVIIKKLILCQ